MVPEKNHNPLGRPLCSKCGSVTLLMRVERETSERSKHTFECPKCKHLESAMVQEKS